MAEAWRAAYPIAEVTDMAINLRPSGPPRANCALCLKDKPLQQSHIIPESCYRPLYDEKHRARVLDRRQKEGCLPPIQKGIREPLLCFDCEQFLNETVEKPFLKDWLEADAIPDPMTVPILVHRVPDYTRFKLFHLSVLWRAGVAVGEVWENIYLAPQHEARLRSMLLAQDPGSEQEYPIFCDALVMPDNTIVREVVCQPSDHHVFSMNAYHFIFAGAMWIYGCSGHFDQRAVGLHLRADGTIPIARHVITENSHVAGIMDAEMKRLRTEP